MTPEERARAFNAAARKQAAELPRIQRDALAEIVRQLQLAEAEVIKALQSNPTESAQRRLRQLREEIERALHAFQQAATAAATDGADAAWQSAVNSLRAPMNAAGVEVAGVSLSAARINADALMAAKRMLTDRIADLSRRAVDRLNAALLQHVIGASPLSDTITAVQKIMGGVPRARAMTVAYTEIGRVYSIAHQEAMNRDAALLPNLHKRWLQSRKLHPRRTHVAAHNQIVRYDQPYLVDGEALMFPRDPDGSPGNTINCGCHSIPVVDGSSFGASTIRIDDAGKLSKVRPKS